MKKLFCVLVVFAAIGIAQAGNLLVNGDFEQGSLGWTAWWGGNSNIGVPGLIDPANNIAGVWWSDDGVLQDVIVGSGTYDFGGSIMLQSTIPLGQNRIVVIQAELSDGIDVENPWLVETLSVDATAAHDVWINLEGTIVNSSPGANLRINLFMIDQDGPHTGTGTSRFDNLYVGPEGTSAQARFPNPTNNEIVPPSIDDLSWVTPDPNSVGDTVTCDVYFEPNDLDPYNFTSAPIATGVTASTVNLSSLGVSVNPNTTYTWRVDCTDSNFGTPITTQGDVWFFKASNDEAPLADAGADQYNWWGMDDGDGDTAKVTVTMAGNVTDDSNSTLTTLWTLIYSEQDPATQVNIIDAGSQTTTVEIDGTGLFRFQLDADDAYSHSDDIVEIFITPDACAAAQIDPTDHYQTYTYVGDVNDDCMVNMTDLAIMASTWLDCLTDKIGCTP